MRTVVLVGLSYLVFSTGSLVVAIAAIPVLLVVIKE